MDNHTGNNVSHWNKHLLFVEKGNQDSSKAIKLLKGFKDFKVIYIKEKDDETVTPCLMAPTGNFYGVQNIRAYVDYERKLEQEVKS